MSFSNSSLQITRLASMLGALLLSACAATGRMDSAPTLAVLDHVDDIAAENGDRILIARDYLDEIKLDGGTVQRRYQYAWNYSRSIAQERVFDIEGKQISLNDMPALSLSATKQEQNYAFSLVRADKRWASYLPPGSTLYGGFIYREPENPQCSTHSRCIHVFASNDSGQSTTLHVIVNLISGQSFAPRLGAGQDQKPVTHRQQETKQ